MELKANTSNNTVYADAEGNIAYWHGNFIPIRDKKIDWSKPVDGTTAATEWKGLHPVNESVHIYNPPNGWIQNCNSTPFTAAGLNSPKKDNYPFYMAPDGENFRAINAVRVLEKEHAFTIDKVIAAGYDRYLAGFEDLIPALINAFEKNIHTPDSLFGQLNEPISILKKWDLRTSENSIATTLAVEWGQKLLPYISRIMDDEESDQVIRTKKFVSGATDKQLLQPLVTVINELKNKFGKWQIPWGEINRYQRLTGDLQEKYNDDGESLPDGYAASQWGMLPSFVSRYYPGTKKRYGYNGNSFICAVEFGKKIIAKSLLAGGESGSPSSVHFNDQALMYTKGIFKDVLFYKEDILKKAEKTYHPGE
jgi:acyl-homoserine lactone acylase PvdQ